MPHCGQRRRHVGSSGKVVEAHDADVIGDFAAGIVQGLDGANGHHVSDSENGIEVDAVRCQLGDGAITVLFRILGVHDKLGILFEPGFLQCLAIAVAT